MAKQKERLAELREKTADELQIQVAETTKDFLKRSVDRHFSDSVKSHVLRDMRKDRARMLTIRSEKLKDNN
ncbi:50S ribosomal protein L29 [bacterium]|uniref:Large ribosomal subunit protein uL29 n=2 Tax=Katanobacteria TaxID=422282 RepID=A0A2M7X350_UNCKA|nr:50S ribosomal protein L29 [bacterium]PIP56912.1 MAG: 50S ribosomal protein L29 [candidate division WWE3 bacterium CG22_combo_CG10-13_8_21_14_all_39_12]PJA40558.1 MAG: 50S ribosomal protein L29 [candidate division WWE3 bacterium CG_4_9_14_3_um_filter_39_7]